jgi:hypothetical protein
VYGWVDNGEADNGQRLGTALHLDSADSIGGRHYKTPVADNIGKQPPLDTWQGAKLGKQALAFACPLHLILSLLQYLLFVNE